MLIRCYNKKDLEKNPTYKNTTVCIEWCNFQNFAQWFEKNYIDDWALDKDILVKGNKVYSPETCCFVPREINEVFKNSTSNKDINFLRFYKMTKKDYIISLANKYKNDIENKCYLVLINFNYE